MKNARVLCRIVTGAAAAFMAMASIPDVLRKPLAISIVEHLGHPAYLLPFLGTAKLFGASAVLVPRFPRLQDWACRLGIRSRRRCAFARFNKER
jgi:hypothetical protein